MNAPGEAYIYGAIRGDWVYDRFLSGKAVSMQPALAKMCVDERAVLLSLGDVAMDPRGWLRTEAQVRQLLANSKPLSDSFKAGILGELRKKRLFASMQLVAERMIAEGTDGAAVYEGYGQALIETGNIAAAIRLLDFALEKASNDEKQRQDICGVMGRAYKQRFIQFGERNDDVRRREALKSALQWYAKPAPAGAKVEDWQSLPYHAINVVALQSRAASENPPIEAVITNVSEMATALLTTIAANDDPEGWDCAIAAEACVALGDEGAGQVMRWINQYVSRCDVDAFEIGATLRQFTEVWRIKQDDTRFGKAINKLQSALFDRQGGAIDLGGNSGPLLEDTAAGKSGVRPMEWVGACMERSRSVGLVTTPTKYGTGFLVNGLDLETKWNYPVLLTNSHVISGDDLKDISVRFLGAPSKGDCKVVECLCASAPDAYDFAVLRLTDVPADVACAPVKKVEIVDDVPQRAYVMGYPDAGALSVSLYDNALVTVGDRTLHYTSMTEPGSSGSPVFNEDWDVIGVHHGVNNGYTTDGVPYQAHEAIKLESIMSQAKLEPKPRWPR
jgi:hypothetical protein